MVKINEAFFPGDIFSIHQFILLLPKYIVTTLYKFCIGLFDSHTVGTGFKSCLGQHVGFTEDLLYNLCC